MLLDRCSAASVAAGKTERGLSYDVPAVILYLLGVYHCADGETFQMKVVASMRPSEKSHANRILREVLKRFDDTGECLRDHVLHPSTELYMQWGFKRTPALLSALLLRIPFVILDLGYFDPDRVNRYSVSINGFHNLSLKPSTERLPPRPKPKVMQLRKEWGDSIFVIGQMPFDASLRGMDVEAWATKAAVDASAAFARKAVKRPHPRMLNPWEPQQPALEDTYDDAFCYITLTSTAAVQTMLNGCPTIAMHPANPAFPVASHDMRITFPTDGELDSWVHNLSHREYCVFDPKDCDALATHIIRNYDQAKVRAARADVDTLGIRP